MSRSRPASAAVRTLLLLALLAPAAGGARFAVAQPAEQIPAVGVVSVVRRPVTQASEFIGKIQAKERVNVVARVAAFLDQRLFTEGAEVKAGDLLYRLEQGPFQADIQAKQAAVTQFKAQLQNAIIVLDRAKTLLRTAAGMQANVDAALANKLSLEAQVQGAEAQLMTAQINLAYTEIRAPIDGKTSRSSITQGNYVTPGSGVLTTVVSQDPMYVVFPISTRAALELRHRDTDKVGLAAVVLKIRLPDGTVYGQTGVLDFVDNTIAANTDTITLRGTIPNPELPRAGLGIARELFDGELITVILEDAKPAEALAVPMAAILSDQEGNYVYVVDGEDKAQIRRVVLAQSTPAVAMVMSGLREGESVILEGIQRVRAGRPVKAAPATQGVLPGEDQRGTASGSTSAAPRG
jgi:membrane fusion protein (multidrug efflux system)